MADIVPFGRRGALAGLVLAGALPQEIREAVRRLLDDSDQPNWRRHVHAVSRAVASHSYGREEHLLAFARGCAVLLHSTRTDARGRDDLAMVGFQRLLWLDLASGAATAAVRLQALADLAPDRLAWRDGALELAGTEAPLRLRGSSCMRLCVWFRLLADVVGLDGVLEALAPLRGPALPATVGRVANDLGRRLGARLGALAGADGATKHYMRKFDAIRVLLEEEAGAAFDVGAIDHDETIVGLWERHATADLDLKTFRAAVDAVWRFTTCLEAAMQARAIEAETPVRRREDGTTVDPVDSVATIAEGTRQWLDDRLAAAGSATLGDLGTDEADSPWDRLDELRRRGVNLVDSDSLAAAKVWFERPGFGRERAPLSVLRLTAFGPAGTGDGRDYDEVEGRWRDLHAAVSDRLLAVLGFLDAVDPAAVDAAARAEPAAAGSHEAPAPAGLPEAVRRQATQRLRDIRRKGFRPADRDDQDVVAAQRETGAAAARFLAELDRCFAALDRARAGYRRRIGTDIFPHDRDRFARVRDQLEGA